MSSSNMALIEMVFSAVVVLGFCVWQLISVNRDIRARKEREAQLSEPPRDPSADK
jgi:hypothetical protein